MKDEAKSRAAGVNGALVSLTDTAAGAPAGRVRVGIDVSAWATAGGANWADRARLVQLPACALITPGAEGCTSRTPISSHRDGSGRLVAEVDMPKSPAFSASGLMSRPDTNASSPAAPQMLAPQGVALAVEAGPAGAAGDFTATPLLPSASWQAGSNAANFTYGYTVEVPSAIAGPSPGISLGYDSSSIDGRTASTNAQAGVIGEGWDWHPGSISRTYKGCKDAGIAESGDECWAGDILSLNLAGHAGQIVRDDATCEYHVQGEDGTKIERLTGQRNSAWKGEGFKVTTTDGTQYHFGSNRLPGGDGTDPEAKSVSTVPVYFNSGQDKCLGAQTPANGSWVQMGWQWNLDYVVDPHQNLVSYRYEQENNYYGRGGGQNNGTGTATLYQRASYPTWIGYGQRLPDQIAAKGTAKPAAQVILKNNERCVPGGVVTCAPDQRNKTNAKSWPDTPVDQECAATGQCLNLSPTYFTTKKFYEIYTEVRVGTAWRKVDSYALKQSFQDPGDGTSPTLWLDSIQRTGSNGKTAQTLPAVSFAPLQMANRVDGVVKRPDGTEASAPSYNRPRIQAITTETGGRINVVYRPVECSRLKNTMPSSEDGNTMACMPVKWYLPGQSYADPVNDWFNKIVVQSVTEQDMVAGQVATVTDYEYGGGIAWHRNDSEFADPKTRTWDQFRGFATVTTRAGNGSAADGPRTKSVTTYLRGMDGDVLANGTKRSVTISDAQGGTIKDEDVLSGFIRQTQTYDGDNGSIVGDEVTTPWLGAVTATRAQSGGMPAITARAMNTGKVTSRAKLANGTWRTSERTSTYDGTLSSRPLQVDDRSDLSRPEQRLCTTFEYAAGPGGAVTQLVSRTLVLSGACGQNPTAANTVGDTRSFYDGLPFGQSGVTADQTGNEVLERYDGSGKPVYRLNSTSTFDAFGRVTSTTNKTRKDAAHPDGAVTRTEYKPATGSLPTEVVHTNPLGWKSSNTLDPGRSLPLKTTDENGRVGEREYDAFGRVVAIWQPGQERANSFRAVREFSYAMNGTNAPSTVLSKALMKDGQTYTSSYTIYDGLGRIRQTQATPGSGVTGRLITDALFDSHGRQVKTSAAYYNDEKDPSGALFLPNGGVNPDSRIPAQSVSVFDGLGRATASVFQSFGVEQWRSKTEYPGADEVRSIPPMGGYATASVSNGTTSVLRQYKSNTPTGAYDETTYEYNAQGKELRRKDSAGNEWTFAYDLLGRTVKTTDPDAGTATTVYDDSKNLVTATDARGKSATTVTDLLGRTTATYEGTAVDPAKQVGGFTYDTKVLGKPSSSTRYVGGAAGKAYVSEVTGYDGGYRALGTKTTIPTEEGELAGVYETANTYSQYGQLETTKLPAVPKAGLNAETLTYDVDIVGNLLALDGTLDGTLNPYLVDVRYDAFGRPLRSTVGKTARQVVSTIDYDAATGRPVRSTLDKQTAATASVDVLDYTYSQAGQLTSIGNTQDGATRDLQCFNSDYLGRLTQAWTDTGTQTTAPQPSVRGVGGCVNSGGPAIDGTGKPSVGGPAPYWQQYEYDKLGNRTKLVRKDVTGNAAKDTTVTQTFGSGPNTPSSDPKTGGGTGGPHALLNSTETSPSGTKVTSYTYDAVGNTASITSTPGTKTLTWNDQGKLDKITGTGESAGTSYVYDTGGNQLIRREPGKTILNLGSDQITLDTGTRKVSDVRTYPAGGGLSVTRTTTGGTSTLAYQASDHHGTNGVQFNATDLAQVRRPADPFGNERGTQPAPGSWAGDKGFVGGTKEASTGLTLLGAREYDPATGRFISPDPIIDAGDPQQWNAYSYSNNNPINASDPSGLLGCEDADECANKRASQQTRRDNPPAPRAKASPSSQTRSAQSHLDSANGEVVQAKKRREELQHAVVDLIGDLIGFNDARDCFTKGDVMACINTALGAVPWGKIMKAIKVGIKAFKIYKEMNKAYDAIHAAESKAARAMDAFSKAKRAEDEAAAAAAKAAKSGEAKAAKETAGDSPGTEAKASKADADADSSAAGSDARSSGSADQAREVSCNSFPAGTRVQMADGTTKALEDVQVGDTVLATDPQTGVTRPQEVTAAITTPDDKEFTDLTLTDDANPRGPPAELTSTSHHPQWNETRSQWVDAGQFLPGEKLRQPNGTTLTVSAVRNYPFAVTTHNLTVNDFHTYYVLAGATPVLVHNCGEQLEFAHGTTASHADAIAANGLSSEAARAATSGGGVGQPGNLFSYRVSGGSDPNFSTAAQWGVTRNRGKQNGAAVLVFRMCKCTYDRLVSEGHITTRTTGDGMPEEVIFGPGAMPFLRKVADVRLGQ